MTIPPPDAHGGDGPSIARALGIPVDDVLDLSLSLNPCAPELEVMAARHLDSLRRYPDSATATRLLAEAIGVESERVILTNGGAQAIDIVRRRVGGSVASEPEFSLHPRGDGGPAWRSDPHNPTGLLAASDAKADVWDEAFYPLATGRWTAGRECVAVVGSLTKVFACPGLRLGYVIGEGFAAPEWSVNSLALALLPELLERAELDKWARQIAVLRDALVDLLDRHGLRTRPSDANWVLVEASGLRSQLAHHGVVIRDCTSFGLPDTARIAVPDEPGLERLAKALAR